MQYWKHKVSIHTFEIYKFYLISYTRLAGMSLAAHLCMAKYLIIKVDGFELHLS